MRLFEKYVKADFESYEDFARNYKINKPEDFNFSYDVIDELARTKPDKRALVWCDDNGGERTFTFGELKKYSDKTANYLKSMGIRKGDMVMAVLKGRYEFWWTILALHKIGAVIVPATHLLTKKDLVYRNNAADIKAIICVNESESPISNAVEEAEGESPTLKIKMILDEDKEGWSNFTKGVEAASEDFERPVGDDAPHGDDIMILYFTSGTTGYPKMVIHDFFYPLAHITTSVFWHNSTEDGLHYTVSDTGWAKAIWGKIYGQWLAETCVFAYDYDKFVPENLLNKLVSHKVTTFCAPPTIYRFLIREDLTKYDLSSLKYCTIAGEPLNPEVYMQFYNLTGHKLMEAFGQTELTVTVGNFIWMDPKPGSMGKPNPLYDVRLINDMGEEVDPGASGEIAIKINGEKPIGMFMGYYRDKEKTDSVWYDGFYHTGDIAWKDEDGYLWYVGRADDVIKTSGYRVGPFEVESAIMEHPAVLETAITGVPDEIRGQVIKATIVLNKGYRASDELAKEIQDYVKRTTAPYKYPRIVEFVEHLPKTISGKIRRVQIRGEEK